MWDEQVFESLAATAERAADSPASLATVDQLSGALLSVRQVVDRLEGLEAALLAAFEDANGPVVRGSSSTAAWARQHLRLDGRSARARVKAGRTLKTLPVAAEASRAGRIRLAHVQELSAALTKAGTDVVQDAEDWLVDVARTCDPAELRGVVHQLVDVVHPERLDQAWVDGMDKSDVHLSRVGDGYALSGFLDVLTGAQVKTWLDSAAAPIDADDLRAPSERRVDALGRLVSSALEHGLRSDRGVRPQLHVVADLDTLLGDPAGTPATLTGYGPIGPELLDYLRCTSDLTPLLAGGETAGPTPQAAILNVGRTRRLATTRQRTAVRVRQDGVCAAPGCRNTHLEIHHARWWNRDHGPTDLDNLIGLCPRCHQSTHAGRLDITADEGGGFCFTREHRTAQVDHWRRHRARIRRHLKSLRRAAAEDAAPSDRAWPTTSLLELRLRVALAVHPPRLHRRQ